VSDLKRKFAKLLLGSALGLLLAACGGGGEPKSTGPSQEGRESLAPLAASDIVATDAEAARFLIQSTYGPNDAAIARLRQVGYSNWLALQFNTPSLDTHWDYVARKGPRGCTTCESIYINATMESFWQQALQGRDQLRQRLVFALSEIFVVSSVNSAVDVQPDAHAAYLDMLSRHAFGNFRDLLEGVARHPTMGYYLSHIRNQKEDEATGRNPDENFAREVMQLFSIGLWQLNDDGSRKKDAHNQDIPTYGLEDVMGMARVMTGLSWGGPHTVDDGNFGWKNGATWNVPMQMYPSFHSQGEKRFLGVTIPRRAGNATLTQAEQDLKIALDTLFQHPNVGPFIGKQLIKRFVTSNPSPAYVTRVSQAFNNNGRGVRGDMQAVMTAILLDPEARDVSKIHDPTWGKLREPIVRYANFLRAFHITTRSGRFAIHNLEDPISSLGQNPLRAPSVFNWFQPDYAPSGELMDAGLSAPEFQITHETTLTGYTNFMERIIQRATPRFQGDNLDHLLVDYSREIELAATPDQLLDRLNLLLMAGQMTPSTRTAILDTINGIQRTVWVLPQNEVRTHMAIRLIMASPEYLVQK